MASEIAGTTNSQPGQEGATRSSPNRLESLDQFRGYTVAGMFLVNFLGSYALVTGQFPNLKHHNTFCSYADTIMPQFFFAVGFGYRVTLLKRLEKEGWLHAYGRVLQRIVGLLFIAAFVHGLDGQYKSWSDLQSAGVWTVLSQAFGRNYFQTLTHIALASLWVTPVIAASTSIRAAYFVLSAVLHVLISYLGFYQWVHEYRGIDGGYLGFMSWALVVLAGSFAYDIMLGSRAREGSTGSRTITIDANKRLLAPAARYEGPMAKLRALAVWSVVLMCVGYGLSCLNRVTPPNDLLRLQNWSLLLNTPPFFLPTEPVNLWTMSQRAGSVSYMIFSSGFSMFVFGAFVLMADQWKIKIGLFRTLGVNALAAYVLHDWVNGVVKEFVPKDSPIPYAVLGFLVSFMACYLMLRSFERQKIFFRI